MAEIPEIVCENAWEEEDAKGVDADEVPEVACVPFLREVSLEEESMVRSPEGMLEAKGAGLVGTANAVDIQAWGCEDGLARRKKSWPLNTNVLFSNGWLSSVHTPYTAPRRIQRQRKVITVNED